ncbi:unnamed protein product [Caenorhabditis auriculariae]|uniref:SH3 domain-containing protein n=1 Tax=Caenorhabditis auriculariae TaxID=2777116 RepID=A0A8S1HNZ8_9PELO|nr:unnamed protein product [Caenorhabditis auriculariae]
MSNDEERLQVCFAEAIYTNVAEYPEELAFERGDVLRVLSKNPGIDGISEGWWLCVDRKGRKGVVPANRLQVMQRFADEDVAKGVNFVPF